MTRQRFVGVCFVLAAGLAVLALAVRAVPTSAAAAGDAATPAKRHPEPDAAAQEKAEALIREVYKAEYATRKPAERLALARKLSQQAAETADDPAARFVLLREARDLAAAAGDVASALRAVDELAKSYRVDGDRMKFAVLGQIPAADARTAAAVARAYLALSEDALAADEMELAADGAAKANAVAPKARDPSLLRQVKDHLAAVQSARQAYDVAQEARKKLAAEPGDPGASLAVGRYLCFVRGDWAEGLPMLAKGSEPALKELAEKELKGPAEPAAMAALAEAWWGLPDGRGGVSAAQARQRAVYWYEKALPKLTGLTKAAAEKRIAEVHARQPLRTVDLLALVDPAKHVRTGTWSLVKEGLSSGRGADTIHLPYTPPAEYDLRAVFARTGGNDNVGLVVRLPGGTVEWGMGGWGNNFIGFMHWAGGGWRGLVSKPAGLKNGRRYTVLIQVRRDRARAYVDGKLAFELKGDEAAGRKFGAGWDVPGYEIGGRPALGLDTGGSPTTFYTLEVVEVSGQGRILD